MLKNKTNFKRSLEYFSYRYGSMALFLVLTLSLMFYLGFNDYIWQAKTIPVIIGAIYFVFIESTQNKVINHIRNL